MVIVGLGVGMGDADGEDEGLGDGVGVGFGVGLAMATPLFQTSFFALLMHVYFFPAYVEVEPALEHDAPAFGEASAEVGTSRAKAITRAKSGFFMTEVCDEKGIITMI